MSKSRRRESIVRLQKSRYGHRIGALWQHDVSTLQGFFQAAARRSKRGYGDTLPRCNDAGEAARVLSRDLNQRFPDGTGLQWDGTNFWGTTADGMKVKLGSLTYRDFTVTPTANSGSMSIDISDIPNYKDLILWETLFPRMLSDLDMANWNTSMLRTGVGYDWNYNADKGILSISSRHTECVLIQYGTGLKQRTVRVHYI